MISLSIALAFMTVVIVLGVRDIRLQASRERIVLLELQGKFDAEKRELTEALVESNQARTEVETLAAADRKAMKTQFDALATRVTEAENRLRNVTAPGRMR